MSKKTFKKHFSINLLLYFSAFVIILGLFFGLIVRNNLIKKQKNYYSNKLKILSVKIQSKTQLNQDKLFTLGNIIESQINTPKVYFQISKLMKDELLSSPYFEKIFILLNSNIKINDTLFYNSKDSLGRINLLWYKTEKGLVLTDNYTSAENEQYYQTEALVQKPIILQKPDNQTHKLLQIIVIPLMEGNTFVGIIGIEINPNFFNSIFSSEELSKNIFIVDNSGTIIYTKIKDNIVGKKFTKLLSEFNKYEEDLIKGIQINAKGQTSYLLYRSLSSSNIDIPLRIGLLLPKKLIYRKANTWFLLIMIISIIIPLLYYFIIKNQINNLDENILLFVKITENLKNGNISEKIDIQSKFKEIDELSNNLKNIQERFLDLTKILNQIKEQQIKDRLKPKNDKDIVAQALSETLEAISKRQKIRKQIEQEKQKEDWINEGLNKIHEASKTEKDTYEGLANVLNETITSYSDAFLSIIYIVEQKDKVKFLKSISAIGLSEQKAFKKEIEFGDGVVGAVALEKKTMYFDKIPDDYHIIVSGLSLMKPKSILVLPLMFENELYGIIEISFLRILKDYELKFFETASTEIAISFKNISNALQTEKLLQQMKEKNEQIEKAQTELQKKIEELKQKDMETRIKEADLQSLVNAVNNTLMTIQYSIDGSFISANEKYLKTMHYSLSDLKGKNVLDLVKTERAELESVIRRVSQGENYEKIMKRFTKYGEVRWLYSTYTPYYDTNGKITKILYFAIDVTDTKTYIEKLEKEINILKKQVKLLREKI